MSSREELTNVQLSKMLAENQRALDEQIRVTAHASQEIARLKKVNDDLTYLHDEEVEKYERVIAELHDRLARRTFWGWLTR